MGWQGRYLFLYDLTLLEESGHQVIFLEVFFFEENSLEQFCGYGPRKAKKKKAPPPMKKETFRKYHIFTSVGVSWFLEILYQGL
jgi:hypothetical protein